MCDYQCEDGGVEMTIKELIGSLQNAMNHGTKQDSIVEAWDPETNDWEEVTGFTHGGDDNKVRLYTDVD